MLYNSVAAPGARLLVCEVLRVRYMIRGRKGEVTAHEVRPGHFEETFMVAVPHGDTLLYIKHATYGHPRGVIKGRGAFDVTEV